MNELARLDQTRQQIDAATSIAEVKDIRDKLEALRSYARSSGQGREQINSIAEAKVEAECKGGELLAALPREQGKRTDQTSPHGGGKFSIYKSAIDNSNISSTTAERWQIMKLVSVEERNNYYRKTRGDDRKTINSADVYRFGLTLKPHEVGDPPAVEPNTYHCIVVDPPWQMQKIEREERINQAGFDYPTMSVAELADATHPKWHGAAPAALAADDCHLYLWTTQKRLPEAFGMVEAWGFKYQCMMTWVKNVGFTPFSWMYSTEHVLFCRKGNLPLLKNGLRLDFKAKVREHSRKPNEFYELVRRASPSPRIDLFGREPREGFDVWGSEINKF